MSELGKPFLKKNRQKPENQCQNATCEQETTIENGNLVQQKIRRRMNYEWIGKTIQKKSNPKSYPSLTSKVIKMSEQILKKRQRPI